MNEIYELIILGAGPAGTAAGVYASRKQIKALLISDGFGGQAVVAAKIENIIGQLELTGVQMAKIFEEQVRSVGLRTISDKILAVKKEKEFFQIETANNGIFRAKNILVALGRQYKNLEVPGEEKFKGQGVAYCSTCDAPLFRDKAVAVIGGGNAALSSVIDLFPYASKIYLLTHSNKLKGDQVLQEEAKRNPKAEIIIDAQVLEILGDLTVSGLKFRDLKTQKIKELKVEGVFVQVGRKPNSELVKNLLKLNEAEEIITEPLTGRTSEKGIWAAGDITNLPYKQINVAMADGIRALLDIYSQLKGVNLKDFI